MDKAQTGLKRTMRGIFPNLMECTTLKYNILHYKLINLHSMTGTTTKKGPRAWHSNAINRINNTRVSLFKQTF